MRLREIPEDFQRIIKWASENKEALDVTYRDACTGRSEAVTALVQDAKGERIWLVTLDNNDVVFGYESLVDITPSIGFPVQ